MFCPQRDRSLSVLCVKPLYRYITSPFQLRALVDAGHFPLSHPLCLVCMLQLSWSESFTFKQESLYNLIGKAYTLALCIIHATAVDADYTDFNLYNTSSYCSGL